MAKIREILAREILDSRGFPTVEVEVAVEKQNSKDWAWGKAMVPSGASTGEHEALELRDGDSKRYLGKGVLTAVQNVNKKIKPALLDRDFPLVSLVDDALINLDNTPNKSSLGANAILGVSMAFTRAIAESQGLPVYEYLASQLKNAEPVFPVPLMNVINGGKHADNELSVQEFMIVPAGFDRFSDALRAGCETFHRLKKLLLSKELNTAVGDEGGFAPNFPGAEPHEQALQILSRAISDAGYQLGKHIFLAIDVAASEFLEGDKYLFEGELRTSEQMIETYRRWIDDYPIVSIEDGLAENDWEGWKKLTDRIGNRCQLVGDDLFVTNPKFLKKGIETSTANAILIKLNQIGTVTETLETMRLAQEKGYQRIVSHRSGETEDTFIADLAIATSAGQIKTGSASRTDRIAKYNQLLRIEEKLGSRAKFAGPSVYSRLRGSD